MKSTRPPPSTSGITYSPIIGMNTSSVPVTRPGAVSRSVIWRNAAHWLAPRSVAASTSRQSIRSSVA